MIILNKLCKDLPMNRKINKKEMKLLNEILSKSKLTLKDAEAISDKIDKSITKKFMEM